MEGSGTVVGKLAPDFTLPDHRGGTVTLSKVVEKGPVLLAFYPKDFTMVCTKQLCNYTDNFEKFGEMGVQIFGVSHNAVANHSLFAQKYKFPFPLLADLNHVVTKAFGSTSMLMMGRPTRSVFIISRQRIILYKYVEPTVMTHRSADELLKILQDLRRSNLV
jgi:peroxiredoxin Q/BCP